MTATPCPSPESLLQFICGTLCDTEEDRLNEHISQCSDCQQSLDQLSDDAELNRLRDRHHSAIQRERNDPALNAVIERFGKIPLAGSASNTPAPPPLTFLTPTHDDTSLGTIGHHRVLERLGSGGMAVVLKAWDEQIRRTVAIKVLWPEPADETVRERFIREARAARALAQIAHVNVPVVFAIETPPDKPPYFVMEFVAGTPLSHQLKAGPLDPRQAARICAEVADGLAAAHAVNVIHRDVKPSNIIDDAQSHHVWLIDFGIAKVRTLPAGLTHQGTVTGTPAYMSPEQLTRPERVDARTDVYGLGATLYQCLTGQPPFDDHPSEALPQLVAGPTPPRAIHDSVPPALETITLKCLAREPQRRYQSIQDLATDLRRWLDGETIHARPRSLLVRLRQWFSLNYGLTTLFGISSFALLICLLAVLFQWRRDVAGRLHAEQRLAATVREGLRFTVANHTIREGDRIPFQLKNGLPNAEVVIDLFHDVDLIQRRLYRTNDAGAVKAYFSLKRRLLKYPMAKDGFHLRVRHGGTALTQSITILHGLQIWTSFSKVREGHEFSIGGRAANPGAPIHIKVRIHGKDHDLTDPAKRVNTDGSISVKYRMPKVIMNGAESDGANLVIRTESAHSQNPEFVDAQQFELPIVVYKAQH